MKKSCSDHNKHICPIARALWTPHSFFFGSNTMEWWAINWLTAFHFPSPISRAMTPRLVAEDVHCFLHRIFRSLSAVPSSFHNDRAKALCWTYSLFFAEFKLVALKMIRTDDKMSLWGSYTSISSVFSMITALLSLPDATKKILTQTSSCFCYSDALHWYFLHTVSPWPPAKPVLPKRRGRWFCRVDGYG